MKYLLPLLLLVYGNSFSQTTGCPVPVINYSINCGDDSTQLTASSGYTTYSWAPSTGLSNPNIANPMVALTSTPTTYVLTATIDTDLIVNGDFSLGNTGFTSALNFTSLYSPGDYYVAPTFFLTSYSMGDHTPTTDEMFMSVDGISYVATLWEETIPVIQPSTTYQFSFWGTDCNVNPPRYEIHFIGNVTGDVIVGTQTAALGTGVWNWGQYGIPSWNSGANTSVIIRVKNLEINGYGNDFGLDDFSFRKSCTTTASVTISGNPLAPNFSADTVCVGSATTFTDHSTGGATSWSWDFGDGTATGTGPNPTHIYAAAGTYNVALTIVNATCDSTFTLPVIVDAFPVAAFTADTVCTGSSTILTDHSTGSPVSWSWNFGDGSPISTTGPAITHAYGAAGTYNVSLTVTNSGGCGSVLTQSVIVYSSPTAHFTIDTVCLGTPTTFTDLSTGSPVAWNWDFGDGSPLVNTTNATHVYTAAGTYIITHLVTSIHGCANTAIDTLVLNPLPVAAFASANTCEKQSSLFTDNSTGTPTSWNWSFGDGSNSITENPAHQYSSSGSYAVTLIINTAAGCTDTISQNITVYQQPTASFTSNIVCSGSVTGFVNTSSTLDGSIVGAWWNFGDGTTATTTDPTHILGTTTDSSNVTLVILTSYGCVDTITQVVTTYPTPVAGFSAFTDGETFAAQFTDLSSGATIWNWNLGDNTTSSTENPYYVYPDTGTYLVTQIVINQFGCADTAKQTVHITAETTIYIPNAFTPNGNGNNDIFLPKMYGVIEFEMLIFDRWGNQIFKSEDKNKGWDGRVNGQIVQQDVYVYKIRARDLLRNFHDYIGSVTVVK